VLVATPVIIATQKYSEGRDQEDHGLRPAWGNTEEDLSQKYLT
jgi:hypothetical protein